MASRPTRLRINLTQREFIRCDDTRKVGYATRDEALIVAEQLMERDRVRPGCHITPYLCQHCREWHVGNRRIVATP